MARWWDRWLRGVDDGYDDEPALTWFAAARRPGRDRTGRSSRASGVRHRRGRSTAPPCGRSPLGAEVVAYDVLADVGHGGVEQLRGLAAVGPADRPALRRRSLADFDWPADGLSLLGHPQLRLRLSVVAAGGASVSAKLCDVFPDGTSSLV